MRTDEELMQQYQDGNYAAFQELYQRYSGRVYGYLMRRIQDRQKTADVFQQTFMKLHQSKSLYSSELTFAPWLFTLCHRVFLDYIKSSQTRMEQATDAFDESGYPDQNSKPSSSEEELPKSVDSVLASLSPEHREILKMRYIDELPFSEISKRLDSSEVSIRKRISRIVQQLRRTAKEQGNNHE